MPSCNTYHLTCVSLTLVVGYLFTAAPAKHSHCSLPWKGGISSPPLLLTLNVELLLLALLSPRSHGCLEVGLLLSATAPDLRHGVAPLGRRPYTHTSKVMFKILQARLQQYMNCELADIQAGFRKGRGTRDQTANICWIIEKAREFQKTSISALLTMPKPLTVWITIN